MNPDALCFFVGAVIAIGCGCIAAWIVDDSDRSDVGTEHD